MQDGGFRTAVPHDGLQRQDEDHAPAQGAGCDSTSHGGACSSRLQSCHGRDAAKASSVAHTPGAFPFDALHPPIASIASAPPPATPHPLCSPIAPHATPGAPATPPVASPPVSPRPAPPGFLLVSSHGPSRTASTSSFPANDEEEEAGGQGRAKDGRRCEGDRWDDPRCEGLGCAGPRCEDAGCGGGRCDAPFHVSAAATPAVHPLPTPPPPTPGTPRAPTSSTYAARSVRCGACTGCVAPDCEACIHCLDKPRHGGPGVKKQACVRRGCIVIKARGAS